VEVRHKKLDKRLDTSFTDSPARSSFTIVPVATAVPSVAPDGDVSVSVSVSSASKIRSVTSGTFTVPVALPAGIVSVPLVAV